MTLFLCGDVMTGRGIDQILPHPSAPGLHESFAKDAGDYVLLAERENGPVPRPVQYAYIWGDALDELARVKPDVRVINLETAITISDDWAYKAVLYRMHPDNIACLTTARIDCCALANNHVLDWGERGLEDTLCSLEAARIRFAGAGRDLDDARAPAVMPVLGKGRVLVFSFGMESSGIPRAWNAGRGRPGVYFIERVGAPAIAEITAQVEQVKHPGDVVVASIHWGPNWGYEVPDEHRQFAHELIDRAAVDVLHGHSSHHPMGIEVYRDRPILYGAGDFLNDYEGIGGYREYRGELSLMYFATLDAMSGRLLALRMTPMRVRRLSLHRADAADARWLGDMLDRESRALGCGVRLEADGRLMLGWQRSETRGSGPTR